MPNHLDPEERAALKECATPEARSALLLEWMLGELRGARRAVPVEEIDQVLPSEKRGPGRPRRTELGR